MNVDQEDGTGRRGRDRRRLGFEMRKKERRLITDEVWTFLEKRKTGDRRSGHDRRFIPDRRNKVES